MGIEQAPQGFGRFEKSAIYILLIVSALGSIISGYQNHQLEKNRLKIEEGILELERNSHLQDNTLDQIEAVIREQEKTKNLIDQRIRLLELVQESRPNVEVFVSSSENSTELAGVKYCFANRSDFSAFVSVEKIEFRSVSKLGELGNEIEPYYFGSFNGIGELLPGHSVSDRLSYRLKGFNRKDNSYQVTVSFKFSSPNDVASEIRAIASDLGIDGNSLDFTYRFTTSFLFTGGISNLQNYRTCE